MRRATSSAAAGDSGQLAFGQIESDLTVDGHGDLDILADTGARQFLGERQSDADQDGPFGSHGQFVALSIECHVGLRASFRERIRF